MIQGLMVTPPTVGRITIGKMVERNGMRLPVTDDEFTITTQVQNRAGWVLHPMDAILRAELANRAVLSSTAAGAPANAPLEVVENAQVVIGRKLSAKPTLQSKLAKRGLTHDVSPVPVAAQTAPPPLLQAVRSTPPGFKLRSIPVRLLFNDPSLNLRASYTLFDRATARPLCVGDGESCKRVHQGVVNSYPCPGPDQCALGMEGNCRLFGRFHVLIDHLGCQNDACSTFVLRTTGVNTVRTLTARMQYFQAISGGVLANLPLELRLRGKSTTQSHRAPIYYVDLCIRQRLGLESAVREAREAAEHARQMGLDQDALDAAARVGYARGLFEERGEDAEALLQEFYPALYQHHGAAQDRLRQEDASDGPASKD